MGNLNAILELLKEENISSTDEQVLIDTTDSALRGEELIGTLPTLINIHQILYNNYEPIIPDEKYDLLYEMNKEYNGEIVGSIINAKNKKVSKHQYTDLRGSLAKVHFITRKQRGDDNRKSLEEWAESMGKIDSDLINKDEVTITTKLDGVSVIFECENGKVIKALTRGDVTTNEAIELEVFNGISMDNEFKFKKYGIKTEVIMTIEDFYRVTSKYGPFKSPRSAVSSILNSNDLDDTDMIEYLTIVPLKVQDFDTKVEKAPEDIYEYPSIKTSLKEIFKDYTKMTNKLLLTFHERMKELGIPCDGAVISLTNESIQKSLGRENAINRYEIAYKFPAEETRSILERVEFDTGRLGTIAPIAKIQPVVMKGNSIKSISLGSMARFKLLGLRCGDEVIVKYDIIPYLEIDKTCKRVDRIPIPYPTECKYCNGKLDYTPLLSCVNDSCPSRVQGKVLNYVKKMSIPGLGSQIIKNLYEEGILNNIIDLYKLKDNKARILEMFRIGEKSFEVITNSIESKKETDPATLLGSLGIQDAGRRIFTKILDIYYIDELLDIAYNKDTDKLTSIRGIGDKLADRIVEGLNENKETIEFLLSKIKVEKGETFDKEVCFTKVRDLELESILRSKGYKVTNSVTKTTNLLVVKDHSDVSSKVTKARKYEIPILSLQEAWEKYK